MIMIPFPFFLAEIILFFVSVDALGWGQTLLLYFAPCLVGLLIVSLWGRVALLSVQASLMRGEIPTGKLMHSGAIFLAGLCFLVPSFFLRLLGLGLLLPGARHWLIWRFQAKMKQKIRQGNASFRFGGFGFSGQEPFSADSGSVEREVGNANVLDVKPLQVSHETKKNEEE